MSAQKPRAWRRGFTLVELVIVILILGILTGVAAPKVLRMSSRSVVNTTLTNVRIIFDTAEVFVAQHGALPRSAEPGEFPEDFAGLLPPSLFTQEHDLGGYFGWNGSGTSESEYGVVLTARDSASSWSEIYFMLEQSDDGLTSTGWIRLIDNKIWFRLLDKSGNATLDAGTEGVSGS